MAVSKIEMVQRRAARFVLRNYNRTSSVSDMLDQLGWKSLQSRRESMRLYMLYKLYHGIVATDGMPLLTPVQRNSRHQNSQAYKVLIQESIIISTLSSRVLQGNGTFCPRTLLNCQAWSLS